MTHAILDFTGDRQPESDEILVLWDRFPDPSDGTRVFSLPLIVRDSPRYWLDEYTAWLADVSFGGLGRRGADQLLANGSGFGYWWMTIPTQFAFSDSCIAYRILRLWAFEQLADQERMQSVELVGAPPEVAVVVRKWASETGREVTPTGSVEVARPKRMELLRGIRFLLAQLRHYGWSNRRPTAANESSESGITVVDYLANCSVDPLAKHPYVSGYWGSLVSLLEEMPAGTRWIHNHYPSAAAPRPADAHKLIGQLNEASSGATHELIQDWNSLSVTFRALGRLWLSSVQGRSLPTRINWQRASSRMDPWPLIEPTWRDWFEGTSAAQNILWHQLFGRALRSETHRDACIYLMENQGWEVALLSSWRSRTHGPSVGVVHSAARRWDLRFLVRRLADHPESLLNQPDIIIANSEEAIEVLNSHGYVGPALREGEAVRFSEPNPEPSLSRQQLAGARFQHLLVIGEYDPRMSERLIAVMNEVVKSTTVDLEVTYRPHPASQPFGTSLDGRVQVRTRGSLADALHEVDTVICSSVSSAMVQAALERKFLIIVHDGSVLDGIPLSSEAYHSAYSAADVVRILKDQSSGNADRPQPPGFFFDSELNRWRTLLQEISQPRV